MKIGIVGTGRIGTALAKHFAKANYEVLLTNRSGPASMTSLLKELGPNAKAGTTNEVANSDFIIFAVDWEHLQDAIKSMPSLKNKIVIDPSNPITPGYQFADLHGKASSEIVASLLPGARIVKAFNTLPAAILGADPSQANGKRVLFMSGDDSEAKAAVGKLIESIGFASVDLGGLLAGSKLQQIPGGTLPTLNLIKLGEQR